MSDIPVAERVSNVIHIKNAKLQQPVFYDPESDTSENYTEFHERTNIFVNTRIGHICFTLLSLFAGCAFCYAIIVTSHENDDKNIDNNMNLTFQETLEISYLEFGWTGRKLLA